MFSENKRAKLEKIVGDVYMWGIQHPFVQTNVMVISEHILYNDRCVAALLLLKEYENNVLLALPQTTITIALSCFKFSLALV